MRKLSLPLNEPWYMYTIRAIASFCHYWTFYKCYFLRWISAPKITGQFNSNVNFYKHFRTYTSQVSSPVMNEISNQSEWSLRHVRFNTRRERIDSRQKRYNLQEVRQLFGFTYDARNFEEITETHIRFKAKASRTGLVINASNTKYSSIARPILSISTPKWGSTEETFLG